MILRTEQEYKWRDAVNALLRAIGDASQEADALRAAANGEWHRAAEIEEQIAIFVLKAAQVRNRFEELEQMED